MTEVGGLAARDAERGRGGRWLRCRRLCPSRGSMEWNVVFGTGGMAMAQNTPCNHSMNVSKILTDGEASLGPRSCFTSQHGIRTCSFQTSASSSQSVNRLHIQNLSVRWYGSLCRDRSTDTAKWLSSPSSALKPSQPQPNSLPCTRYKPYPPFHRSSSRNL